MLHTTHSVQTEAGGLAAAGAGAPGEVSQTKTDKSWYYEFYSSVEELVIESCQ